MMHAFPRTFTPPRLRAERVTQASAAPLSPAAYLTLRREAAGLDSIPRAAGESARSADEVAAALDLFHVLETPGNVARYPEALERLRSVFSFDPDVYWQLAREPADRHPRICRGCGCSEWDPCEHDTHGTCSWSTPLTCTHCLPDTDAAEVRQ